MDHGHRQLTYHACQVTSRAAIASAQTHLSVTPGNGAAGAWSLGATTPDLVTLGVELSVCAHIIGEGSAGLEGRKRA